jgi:hypothetical protein
VFKKWIEEHFKLFGVLLLLLEALNTWVASEISTRYPIMALANGAMGIVIVVGVILLGSWQARVRTARIIHTSGLPWDRHWPRGARGCNRPRALL